MPTAAAFEHPDRAVEQAVAWFAGLGAKATGLEVLNRRDAESDGNVAAMRVARFVYLADGSPLHLRSVLKGSALFDALLYAHSRGAVIAASGAGATCVCDPMVDPRGGAYTVGLGIVQGIAVFPDHSNAQDHRRERSLELQPADAVLVGLDQQTAIVRESAGRWKVLGPGNATVYRAGAVVDVLTDGADVVLEEAVAAG